VALIKSRLGIDATMIEGRTGQFEVFADGVSVVQRGGNKFTRILGAGYPDLEQVVQLLQTKL
jgi:hypothetical protein